MLETDDNAEVFVLSPEELEKVIHSTLSRAGCTLEQLRAEARRGEFSTGVQLASVVLYFAFCRSGKLMGILLGPVSGAGVYLTVISPDRSLVGD